jgi:Family of unknown function (DUF5338)
MQDQTPGRGYGLGRVAFKSFSQEIRIDVEAGYPLTTIFAKYEDRLGITYSQFRRHVQRYIHDKTPVKKNNEQNSPIEAKREVQQKPHQTKPTSQHYPKNFEFNPVASTDDLI